MTMLFSNSKAKVPLIQMGVFNLADIMSVCVHIYYLAIQFFSRSFILFNNIISFYLAVLLEIFKILHKLLNP